MLCPTGHPQALSQGVAQGGYAGIINEFGELRRFQQTAFNVLAHLCQSSTPDLPSSTGAKQ